MMILTDDITPVSTFGRSNFRLSRFKIQLYCRAVSFSFISRCYLLAIVTGSFLSAPSHGDSGKNLAFKHILPSQIESLGYINDIGQDHLGFMWFGGSNGLGRYDGYTLLTFKADPNTPSSLSDSYVNDIHVDSSGQIWVATRNGLNHFHQDKGTFSEIPISVSAASDKPVLDIREIRDAENGKGLWLGTLNGLYRLDTLSLTTYDTSLNATTDYAAIWAIDVDQQGLLWVGHQNLGVSSFNPIDSIVTRYPYLPDDHTSPSSNDIREIYVDTRNRLWAGSYGQGLNLWHRDTQTFQRFPHAHSEKSGIIWAVKEDRDGNIWVGDGESVSLLNIERATFSSFKYIEGEESTPGNFVVTSLFEDHSGDMWLGFFPSGIDIHDRQFSAFQNFRYNPHNENSVCDGGVLTSYEDDLGNLWVGSGFGLSYLNRKNNHFTRYMHDPEKPSTSPSGNTILSVIEDHKNTVWLGIWSGGLNRFNKNTGEFQYYKHTPGDPKSIPGNEPWDVFEDSEHRIWVATERGIARLDKNEQTFTRFIPPVDIHNENALTYSRVLYEDSQQTLWAGTTEGLFIIDRETGKLQHFTHDKSDPTSISSNHILSIFEDSKKRLWIGTNDAGINLYNRENQTFIHFTQANGLPHDSVTGIIEDGQGTLWLSTLKGISHFDPNNTTFRNYDVRHGLVGNLFNRNSPTRTRDGKLVFGSSKGLTIFNPTELQPNTYEPPMVLTDFLIFNEKVSITDPESPIKTRIEKTTHVTLPYSLSVFSIGYSALSYRSPEDNEYAYRLRGFDTQWQKAGSRRLATYTNLDPGEYIFEVIGSNNEKIWTQEPASLRITIKPPVWRTWWAYSFYGLSTLLLILHFIRAQRQKVIKLDRLVAERTQELSRETQRLKTTQDDLQEAYQQLQELSIKDQLTGLHNRRYLTDIIESELTLTERAYGDNAVGRLKGPLDNRDLIFVLLDIDHFKMVNDTYGHTCGDQVLQQCATILQNCVRESDFLVRWGGEEFLIVARASNLEYCETFVERIRSSVDNYDFQLNEETTLRKSCSIGFCVYPLKTYQGDRLSWQQLVDLADKALYAAKHSGRNCWVGITDVQSKETTNPELTEQFSPSTCIVTHSNNISALKWK